MCVCVCVSQDVATGRGLSPGHPLSSPHTQAGGSTQEDIAGVPTSAFVKVARGTPPAEPFTPGEPLHTHTHTSTHTYTHTHAHIHTHTHVVYCRHICTRAISTHLQNGMALTSESVHVCVCHSGAGFVVVVDGARFLPANVTISKVVGTVISPDGQPLTPPFEVRTHTHTHVHTRTRALVLLIRSTERMETWRRMVARKRGRRCAYLCVCVCVFCVCIGAVSPRQ